MRRIVLRPRTVVAPEVYMSSYVPDLVEIPPHVPPERVYDFDMFTDPYIMQDVQEGWTSLFDRAPDIFFTPRNGGHWVLTRYDDVAAMMREQSVFSSENAVVPKPPPELVIPVPPLDMNDPLHYKYRALLNRFLGPSAVKPLEPRIRALAVELIEKLQGRTACEFVSEYAMPLPVLSFMALMQWPTSDYQGLVRLIHVFGGRSTIEQRLEAMGKLDTFLRTMIERLAEQPADDPLSFLLQSQVDGEPLSKQTVLEMGNLLFMGGLDTVTNAMSYITRHFAMHPRYADELRQDPRKITGAVEELRRRLTFVSTGRLVAKDTEWHGVQFHKGEMAIGSLVSSSNDPRQYECPMNVDFGRKQHPPHLAFNTGPHNCAGVHLAKLELRIWLEEWLARMPQWRLKDGFSPHFRGGSVPGLESLDIVWG
jgi:cytochrome P450